MPTYRVPFDAGGFVVIEADSPADAVLDADDYLRRHDAGILIEMATYDPPTVVS